MPEFTVTIETSDGTTSDEETLGRFHDAIAADPETLGPSASLDASRGIIASTFQVEAADADAAHDLAVRLFEDALETVGLRAGVNYRAIHVAL